MNELEAAIKLFKKTIDLCSVPTCAVGQAYNNGDEEVKSLWLRQHEELKELKECALPLLEKLEAWEKIMQKMPEFLLTAAKALIDANSAYKGTTK